MDQMIHSAALYSNEGIPGHVTVEWLERVLVLFKACGLPVREYGMMERSGDSAGPHSYQDDDHRLYDALNSGAVRVVDLLCHTEKKRGLLMSWEGAATINLLQGYAHLGVPATRASSLEELLRQAYTIAKSIAPWRYGIGYSRSSQKAPSMYAVGIRGGSLYPDPNETKEDRERIGCWFRELLDERRHLQGYFRDIYAVNLLSKTHLDAPLGGGETLFTSGWGRFTPVDDGLWIWTVPDEDIEEVRTALHQAGLLICP